MIEVPAAALIAEHIAKQADFFAVGTNDLTQYTLAVDRGNEQVSDLFRPFHPAVLRLLERIISTGRAARIPVSLCGEMAADPLAVPVLVGLGLEEFSMHPPGVAGDPQPDSGAFVQGRPSDGTPERSRWPPPRPLRSTCSNSSPVSWRT